MNDGQMLRYARHIMLDEIGFEGQERLLNSKVLILGVGGLGSPVAMYLAAAGVGNLVLLDHDYVSLSNLQRQIIHTSDRIGLAKVDSAAQAIHALNSDVMVHTHAIHANPTQVQEWIAEVDLVVDCSDNYATRQALNQICFNLKKPLVAAAAIRMQGQITCYDPRHIDSPCYACMYDPADDLGVDNCATLGVFAPLLGVMGSMQAAEAIKLLLNLGKSLESRLALYNALTAEWSYLRIQKNPHCKVCGT